MKNTLHRHVFRLLAENTSVLLGKQSVPQGDLHSAQKNPKYPCLGSAHPSWGAVLRGSCNEVWLVASDRGTCSFFCV